MKEDKLFFNYTSYGLEICSSVALPELSVSERLSGSDDADVIIRKATPADNIPPVETFPNSENQETRPFVRYSARKIALLWEDVGRGLIRDGREIIVAPDPDVPEHVLRLHILGSALGVLLHQRGLFSLHASVVNLADRAVVFMGPWGAGKSTTAATLHHLGHPLVADDVAAIDTSGSTLMVQPGFPQLKLWPNSVTALGLDPEALPKIHPDLDKLSAKVETHYQINPLPLACIYVLYYGDKLAIEAMPGSDALFIIMTDWYGTRFGEDFLDAGDRRQLFLQCARLIREIPIRRLIRPEALEALTEMAELVIADSVPQAQLERL